jgi:lipid II:glycine glycyltransferase (peptidoglycan interpeptide bridge formation enzyme)
MKGGILLEILELTIEEFSNFANNHPMHNYCQTIDYAILMGEYGYDYELIGYGDKNNIQIASLILTKKIGYNCYYGYAPKGFLMDYSNETLLEKFTNDLKEYYNKKNFAFIKIDPEIAIGEVNKKNYKTEYNGNNFITDLLIKNGFKKLKSNLNFEAMFPRFTGIIPLKNFDINNLNKNTRNKINKGYRKGLTTEIGDVNDIDILDELSNVSNNDYYFKNIYNIYSKKNNVQLFLTYINPETFLVNSQNAYVNESNRNGFLNQKMVDFPREKNINNKMASDKTLLIYKNEITEASKMLNSSDKLYVAAALTIVDNNRVTIIGSGYDEKYKRFAPNYYLYYSIINYYKNKCNFLDLNGLSGDFTKDSKYYGLNKFKLGFNPKVYEFIGEFDLITDEETYDILLDDKILAKEFNKNQTTNK